MTAIPTHKQRVLALLSDGDPHTHHELYALHVIGHSRISDLRRDGHLIEQWREGDVYFYRLASLHAAPNLPVQGDQGAASSEAGPHESPPDGGLVSLRLFDEVAA